MKGIFLTIMLTVLALFATSPAHSAVTVIKKDHFEAGKNLSAGQADKGAKHLAVVVADVQTLANATEASLAKYVKYTGAATAGGGATEAVAVTGLGASDVILSVTQRVKGANSLPLLGWQGQAANALTLVYSADPGAGAIVEVFVKKP